MSCAAGCDLLTDSFVTNDFSGDLYPVGIDRTSGAVMVGLREGDVDRVAVLDLLSPVTLVDDGIDTPPSVNSENLIVLGKRSTGTLDLPRAELSDVALVRLHPCADPDCFVGPAGGQRAFQAIVGADALAGDAVRLRLGFDELLILADVAGGEVERTQACDAVFPSPYRGGGTLVIAGTELGFSGRRVTMQTCLGDDPDPAKTQAERGADALMLVSTGIGTTLLGASAYERYRLVDPAALPVDQLPQDLVFLASGPIAGHRATVSHLAFVGRSSSTPRAPCRHVYAHHLLADHDCNPLLDTDCPCEGGSTFCPIPAVLELKPPAGVDVLVISDDDPTLQALRTELRPDQPEVDGIIGTNTLLGAELDIDYPNARVLARCTDTTCVARPALPERTDRASVAACIAAGPIPRE